MFLYIHISTLVALSTFVLTIWKEEKEGMQHKTILLACLLSAGTFLGSYCKLWKQRPLIKCEDAGKRFQNAFIGVNNCGQGQRI